MKSLPHILLVTLALSACASGDVKPVEMDDERSSREPTEITVSVPDRWFPEEPGVYTRPLPGGLTETVIVEAPPKVK